MKKILQCLLVLILISGPVIGRTLDDYHFAVIGDRAGGPDQQAYQAVLNDVGRLGPDFVITVGDNVENTLIDQGDWDTVLTAMKTLSCPVFYAAGNNDIFDQTSARLFREKSGRFPYYSFDYGKNHFVILDNAMTESFKDMDADQVKWLEKDLAGNQSRDNIFVIMHKPFWADGVAKGKEDPMHQLFKKYQVSAVFAGHWHRFFSDVIDGIRYTTVGSSGGENDSRDNPGLGIFYQFIWVAVKNGNFHPALMRSGLSYDIDLVNLGEENFSYDISKKYIKTQATINNAGMTKQLETTVSIFNATGKTIKGDIVLKAGDNWRISRPRENIEISAGDSVNKKFVFSGTGSIFPFPVLNFTYPFGRDKYYEYEGPVPVSRIINCPMAKNAPTIDGQVNAKEWKAAEKVVEFCDFDGAPAKTDPTEIYFMRDGKNLYLAAVCREADMSKLKAKYGKLDDPVYKDDCFGFMLSPNKNVIIQMYVNPQGAVWDQRADFVKDQVDEKWSGEYDIKCRSQKDGWTVEMKIPLAVLEIKENETQIRLNLRRKQQRNNQSALLLSEWSFNIANFGILKLSPK